MCLIPPLAATAIRGLVDRILEILSSTHSTHDDEVEEYKFISLEAGHSPSVLLPDS